MGAECCGLMACGLNPSEQELAVASAAQSERDATLRELEQRLLGAPRITSTDWVQRVGQANAVRIAVRKPTVWKLSGKLLSESDTIEDEDFRAPQMYTARVIDVATSETTVFEIDVSADLISLPLQRSREYRVSIRAVNLATMELRRLAPRESARSERYCGEWEHLPPRKLAFTVPSGCSRAIIDSGSARHAPALNTCERDDHIWFSNAKCIVGSEPASIVYRIRKPFALRSTELRAKLAAAFTAHGERGVAQLAAGDSLAASRWRAGVTWMPFTVTGIIMRTTHFISAPHFCVLWRAPDHIFAGPDGANEAFVERVSALAPSEWLHICDFELARSSEDQSIPIPETRATLFKLELLNNFAGEAQHAEDWKFSLAFVGFLFSD